MMIVTTNDIPGYRIDSVLGEVMGMTVRSANVGANFVASFRAIGGGEISEYTNLVYDSRNQVMQRMWDQCAQRGGNAVVAMRFDTGDIAQAFSEVCAYGTAVVISPIDNPADGGTPQSIAQARAAGQPPVQPAPGQPGPVQPGQVPPGTIPTTPVQPGPAGQAWPQSGQPGAAVPPTTPSLPGQPTYR